MSLKSCKIIMVGGPDDGTEFLGDSFTDVAWGVPKLVDRTWRWAIYERQDDHRFVFTGKYKTEDAHAVKFGGI